MWQIADMYIKKRTVYTEELTSLNGSPRDICSWSSFWSSFRAPMVCWLRTYSESSFKPASVKYLVKCSTLCLLAGNSSWKSNQLDGLYTEWEDFRWNPGSFYHHAIEGRTGGKAQTISLLSMLTFRRLAATALMSFSFIHDLKSFTANAAETPVKERSLSNPSTCLSFSKSSQSFHSRVNVTISRHVIFCHLSWSYTLASATLRIKGTSHPQQLGSMEKKKIGI